MLINELRELTSKSKLYQEEYKVTIIDMSDKVRNRLEKEGLTVTHEHKLMFDQLMSYDTISW